MRRVRLIPLLLSAYASPLVAQWQWSGDLGVSHVRQPALPESNAVTLGGSLDRDGDFFAVRTMGLAARTNDSRTTGQWLGTALAAAPAWHGLTFQGAISASAFGQSNLRPTSSGELTAQARIGEGSVGAAVGGALGATTHNAVTIPAQRALLDAWWSRSADRLAVNASLTRTRAVFGESTILVDISRRLEVYRDIGAAWRHDEGAWALAATVGARGSGSSTRMREWHAVEATAWIAPRTAIALSAGRSLEDLVRGVPRSEYASVALRWSGQPHLVLGRRRGVAGPRLIATVDRDGARVIRLEGMNANSIELIADFTRWEAVALERNGDGWILRKPVTPGPHRVAIRANGGAWVTPVNLPKVEDDLGGTVGLITVP